MNEPLIITTESRIREIFREELAALAIAQARPEPDEWITVTEFCIRTGRNPETARNSVYQKCASRDYPAEKDGKRGKAWRINWTAYCRAGGKVEAEISKKKHPTACLASIGSR